MGYGANRPEFVSFGEFAIDLERRILLRGEERVALTARPLEVLVYLVQNAGRTVTKQELMESVWKDTFVGEDNLTQAILRIRKALHDDKENARFIRTIPRTGYRFVDLATSPARRVRLPRVLWLPGVVVVVLACAAGIWLAARSRSESPAPARAPAEVLLPTASSTKPVFAPDGSFLYVGYHKDRPGVGDLYLAPLSGSGVTRLSEGLDPRGDIPVFSAGGREVVFARWRSGDDGTRWPDLWAVPATGGSPRLLARQASGAGFSPDGSWMAYTRHLPGSNPLWMSPRADLQAGREIAPAGFMPRWSPDGNWIAYTTSNPEGGRGHLWVVSSDLSKRMRLTAAAAQFFGLAWTPDSRSLVFAADENGAFWLWKIPREGGGKSALVGGVGTYVSPSISADGRDLLFSHVAPSRDLYYSETVEGGAERQLTSGRYHHWPKFSPAGDWVASVLQRPGSGDRVYATGTRSGQARAISDLSAANPAWLDGGQLAYLHRDSADGTEVRVDSVTGAGSRILGRFEEPASWLAIHPSGQRVAVVLAASGRQRVVVRELPAQQDRTIAEGGEYEHLGWAPGGNSLSWSGPAKSAGPQSAGIWVAEPGASAPRHLLPDGHDPVWNQDGALLYYSRIGDHSGLWRLDLRTGKSIQVRRWREVDYFDVSRGRLVFARVASDTHIFRLRLE